MGRGCPRVKAIRPKPSCGYVHQRMENSPIHRQHEAVLEGVLDHRTAIDRVVVLQHR